MDDQWRKFLEDAGAVMDGAGRVLHFGNPSREQRAATAGSVIADLSHLGVFTAAGADAESFLQGQLTNDVRRIDAGHSRLGGYCSPKGRLLALLRIFRGEGGYCLQLPAALLAPTVARLGKYILRSKVSLAPAADTFVGIGLSGPHSERELQALTEEIPRSVDEVTHAGALTILRVPGVHPRFMIYGPREAVEPAWSRLNVHAAPVGTPAWTLLDVLAGVPEVHPETVEEFVPQTVNLDLLGGIAFDKGCYTGQEIVARLHYRGTVKRRMYLARCAVSAAPRPGEPVTAPEAGEQAVGHVVSAAPDPEGGFLLLASLVQEHAARGGLRLQREDGPVLELRDLPYLAAGAVD